MIYYYSIVILIDLYQNGNKLAIGAQATIKVLTRYAICLRRTMH